MSVQIRFSYDDCLLHLFLVRVIKIDVVVNVSIQVVEVNFFGKIVQVVHRKVGFVVLRLLEEKVV